MKNKRALLKIILIPLLIMAFLQILTNKVNAGITQFAKDYSGNAYGEKIPPEESPDVPPNGYCLGHDMSMPKDSSNTSGWGYWLVTSEDYYENNEDAVLAYYHYTGSWASGHSSGNAYSTSCSECRRIANNLVASLNFRHRI